MDSHTRKELKSDHFALEVRHGIEYVGGHRGQMLRYGGIGVAAIAIAVGGYFYMQHQREAREAKLATALQIHNAQVGPASNPYVLTFATDAERTKASQKAFSEVVASYGGSEEGTVANYMLASLAADAGHTAEAEKRLVETVDTGKGPYVSAAKIALAEVYQSEGKLADAEKLVHSVMDKPTVLVSKEEATIELAHLIGPTRPQEARKLLEPMRTERSAISRTALTALSELPQK